MESNHKEVAGRHNTRPVHKRARKRPQGPQGPPGSGSSSDGNFTSSNGLYSLSITNVGITLKGPGGKVVIDRALVHVIGAPWVSIEGQER